MTWIYWQSEPNLWTVGTESKETGDSDHDTREAAAARVHYLNGGESPTRLQLAASDVLEALQDCLALIVNGAEGCDDDPARIVQAARDAVAAATGRKTDE